MTRKELPKITYVSLFVSVNWRRVLSLHTFSVRLPGIASAQAQLNINVNEFIRNFGHLTASSITFACGPPESTYVSISRNLTCGFQESRRARANSKSSDYAKRLSQEILS